MKKWTKATNGRKRITTPDNLDVRLREYFESLPPLDDDAVFDQGIIDDVVRQHARFRQKHRSFDEQQRARPMAERIRLALVQTIHSPRLAWSIGVTGAILIVATAIFLLQHRFTSTQAPLALESEALSKSEETQTTEKPDGSQITAKPTEVLLDKDAPARPSKGRPMQFASIPVMFNLRSMGHGKEQSLTENMLIAMKIIARVLERNGVAVIKDTPDVITTNIMVWDANTSTHEKVPLRFVQDFHGKSVVVIPDSFILDTSTDESEKLESLRREIRIEIEDELRY